MSSKKQKATRRTAPKPKATKKRRNSIESGLDASFKLHQITPLTDNQKAVMDAYYGGHQLFLYGVAGTGKSFLSLYLALQDILAGDKGYYKLYIVRSAVPSRQIGFLPGDPDEKMDVYEKPYQEMVGRLFGRSDAYDIALNKGAIEFISTSFLRGITLDHCIVLFDEIQNASFAELDTVITRMGNNSRLVMCGDIEQCDLHSKHDQSGLPEFMDIIERMDLFEFIRFDVEDIVRSGLVRNYIVAKHEIANEKNGSLKRMAANYFPTSGWPTRNGSAPQIIYEAVAANA